MLLLGICFFEMSRSIVHLSLEVQSLQQLLLRRLARLASLSAWLVRIRLPLHLWPGGWCRSPEAEASDLAAHGSLTKPIRNAALHCTEATCGFVLSRGLEESSVDTVGG